MQSTSQPGERVAIWHPADIRAAIMTEGGGDGEPRDASTTTIAVDPSMPVYREILLLAAAWNVTPAEALGRLVDHHYLTQLGRHTGTAAKEHL